MTALAGFWRIDTRGAAPRDSCERMLKAQQVYAPKPPAIREAGDVAIGLRLFATLPEDVNDHGPIIGGGGRWCLAADVRLDARPELCAELGVTADDARTLCDAAVVMRAIERWEDGAIARLVGDFALVLWDARDRRLILARDFLGQRPLHYHRGNGFFAVASMPKGLHALPSVPREANEDAVAEFMALFPDRSSRSFFRGVERVVPGELLVATAQGTKRSRHWNFAPKPLGLRDDQYCEAVRESLDRAVAAQLRGATAGVGAQLSGGLDSSIVASSAARLVGPNGKVIAFTAAPRAGFEAAGRPEQFTDESAHAAATAALYPNIEHVVLRGRGQSPLDELDRSFHLYDRPVLNLCNYVWMSDILKAAQARHLTVLLTAYLGNITISYNGSDSLADRLSRGQLLSVVRDIVMLRRNGVPLRRLGASTVGPFLPRALWTGLKRLTGRSASLIGQSALRRDRAAALELSAASQGYDTSLQPGTNGFDARASGLQWLDFGNYNKGFLGGWGIDVRDPTADRRLVELCLSIPPEQYVRAGWTRAIARQAFADRLPDRVIHERRKGYQGADWHESLRGAWAEVQTELERIGRVPEAASVIDVDRLHALLDSSPDRWDGPRAESDYRLALLRGVSAGHFLRRATGAN